MAGLRQSSPDVRDIIYRFAAEQMQSGVPTVEVSRSLIARGLEPEEAAQVIRSLKASRAAHGRGGGDGGRASQRDAGSRDLIAGLLWFGGGLAVTLITYNIAASSTSGGSFIIATGAIFYGGLRLLRGLAQIVR